MQRNAPFTRAGVKRHLNNLPKIVEGVVEIIIFGNKGCSAQHVRDLNENC